MVSQIRRRRRNRGRPASQVARMAHDQPRQRRRHEHLAAVRPDGRQCAATIHRCDGELPPPGEGSGVRGGCRGHGEQLRPLAPNRFMSDRHRLQCASLQLDLTGEPMVPAPAHGLPIEYMEGPYRYRGTLRGEPVSGFAFYERSLALYRDWELIDVLAAAVDDGSDVLDQLRSLVAAGKRSEARKLLQDNLTTLPADGRDVAEALIEVLSADS